MAPVGRNGTGALNLPTSQIVNPAGVQVHLPGARPQVLALSPDGRWLATSGKTHELYIINPATAKVIQKVPLPSEEMVSAEEAVSTHILAPDKEGQASFTGLIFSQDGRRIFLSNVDGSIKVFALDRDGRWVPSRTIPLPPAGRPKRKNDIPAGLALSADGKLLYVVLNLSNRLLEIDLATGKPLRSFDAGVAPYEVVLVNGKAYISNWGGRRPGPDSLTGPAGRGTTVRVDPIRHIANEGSISIVNLATGTVEQEILTGKHCSALALSADKRYLAAANAGEDTVTIVDTQKDEIIETLPTRWQAADLFGASPNALTFDSSGRLYICNGTQNAVVVMRFIPGRSKKEGLIPAGWFPGAIVHDARRGALYVANIKGLSPGELYGPEKKVKFNSHQYHGSISLIPMPRPDALLRMTTEVLENYGRRAMISGNLPPRPRQPARPVPERPGEPSLIKHVVYIIKENRTYDQVLGDIKEGNGAADLCVFPERVTPNQHKMVREFALLDNTYCSGILSADGHQWTGSAFATDYMEKSFAGFPRSYPDGMEDTDIDALAYSPAGFIWDNAIAHGKTLRDYGEFTIGNVRWVDGAAHKEARFLDIYRDFRDGTRKLEITCRPAIHSLANHIMTDTIGWNMAVPDVFRAARFIKEFREFEQRGELPELMIICLPNDHTSGTAARKPTPAAQVADNDLAFGQIVEAISHSRFWKDTCIFAIEDDPQAGWDHVSGYRTTAYVISPYTKRRSVIHDNYNHVTMLRTIELMLGLPPMNQLDAAAPSMANCFSSSPDFTPFQSVPNQVPLDEMNPETKAIRDPIQKRYAILSAALPLEKPDQCPEDLLNRIIWHAQKGAHALYPAWALTHAVDDDD